MGKETPTAVLKRAVKHFGPQLSPDDVAVLCGAILEHLQAADELLWKHLRVLSLYIGLKEETYIAGQRYQKGAMVRQGEDLYIAKVDTAARLSNSAYWLKFADLPGGPQPAQSERKRKRVQVVEHDAKGRIKTFIETWESEND